MALESGGGQALWVYCVVAGEHPLPAALEGVAPGAPPRLVAADGIAAVVSAVPLGEFGESALRENLNDLHWLERTARAHQAVQDALLEGGAVVPMPVCTIYSDEEHVSAMLEERGGTLIEALLRLAGKAEWGVKAIADRRLLEDHAREQSEQARALAAELAQKSEGLAYLARKKLAALVRDEADHLLDDALREAHARLEEWTVASAVLPAQSRELAGYDGEMVFNGAYLVERERTEPFANLVRELDGQYAPAGLRFTLSGPWPAYNFAAAPSAAGAGR